MPKKKKSHKKPKQNNKKQVSQQQHDEQENDQRSETPQIQVTEVIDGRNEAKLDITNSESNEREEKEDGIKLKKRPFSFLRKKQHSSSLLEINMDEYTKDEKSTTVKRSHSISVFGLEERQQRSKIPLYKFQQSNKKRALTASCNNINSSSLVVNPSVDTWRMEGLLGTVEKANSMQTLTHDTSYEKKKKPDSLMAEEIEKEGNISKRYGIADTKEECEQKKESSENERKPDEGQGNKELSAQLMGGQSSEEASRPTTTKNVITEGEIYEFEGQCMVTVQSLDHVAREKELHFPTDIITNDWLVLNLCLAEQSKLLIA